MKEFFNNKDRFNFYFRFFLNKRRIITDCEIGRLQFFIVELLWIFNGLLGLSVSSSFLIYRNFFKTKYGVFFIHNDLQSAIVTSPTFEFDDIQELISIIAKHIKLKDKILFIDVGAHVGLYSIAVSNKFKEYKDIDIISFEPDANNFYKDNSSIFLKNIKLNNIRNIKLYKEGLGDRDTKEKNEFGFATRKLDSILSTSFAKKYDVIFIKIDIEGYEESALRGSRLFIKNSKKVYLLVEDCAKNELYKYMKNNFKFYKKLTPYNSFWIK